MVEKGHRYKQQFAPRRLASRGIWEEFGEDMEDVMNEFLDYCANILVDSKHGIVLNGLGYFSNTVFDIKKVQIHKNKDVNYNFHSDGEIYTCYFFPSLFRSSGFESWMFRLNYAHKKKLVRNIKNGTKYKNHLDMLRIHSRKYRRKYLKNES